MEIVPIWNRHYHGAHLPDVRHTWHWISCADPHCGHARAIPLAPWLIRWGIEGKDIADAIRKHFYCGVCGRRGGVFHGPLVNGDGIEAFPAIADQVRINGPRRWNETYPAAEERNRAEYLAKYPTGDALGEFRGVGRLRFMCNLYSVKVGQKHIADTAGAIRDRTGNMPPLPAVFPNRRAPIVRNTPEGRTLELALWGFPPPNIPGSKPRNPYLTNIRNTDSKFWLPYLTKVQQRCLVPVTSFAEPDNNQSPRSIWTWFAQDESRPLMFFAGIWREWEGDRGTKTNPAPGKHLVFSFLTTDASPDVAPIHPDATPVLLLDQDAREQWMNTPWEIARRLQKPPPAGALKVIRIDAKEDGGASHE